MNLIVLLHNVNVNAVSTLQLQTNNDNSYEAAEFVIHSHLCNDQTRMTLWH